ncbi:MAG TPA: DUF1345 domain-containing protein [Dongiaceae bacterium]|nr:DUF1345 domain-containing protein [Dongiaceae bacterium]
MPEHPVGSPTTAPSFFAPRARLYLAPAAGIVVYAVLHVAPLAAWLPGEALKPALAWIATTIAYLIPTIWMMQRHGDQERMRARAAAVDIGLGENIIIATLAGAFSLFAVGIVLEGAKNLAGTERILDLAMGVLTVFLSWTTLHVIYAVHYAHIYYDPTEQKGGKERGGLAFPGTKEPDYWDFVYFSFVIGMTCQVSDVQITARHLRHLATAQGIIAFFYNTVVVALAVNIVAGTGG